MPPARPAARAEPAPGREHPVLDDDVRGTRRPINAPHPAASSRQRSRHRRRSSGTRSAATPSAANVASRSLRMTTARPGDQAPDDRLPPAAFEHQCDREQRERQRGRVLPEVGAVEQDRREQSDEPERQPAVATRSPPRQAPGRVRSEHHAEDREQHRCSCAADLPERLPRGDQWEGVHGDPPVAAAAARTGSRDGRRWDRPRRPSSRGREPTSLSRPSPWSSRAGRPRRRTMLHGDRRATPRRERRVRLRGEPVRACRGGGSALGRRVRRPRGSR